MTVRTNDIALATASSSLAMLTLPATRVISKDFVAGSR
jgi:hypothetical protein